MNYYYKYNFISPEHIYANVREELKSYFDTGAIDTVMFPVYVEKCLRKLGKGAYIILETVLHIKDFESRLPDNFYAVREAWLCTNIAATPYRTPSSFYSQASSVESIQLSPLIINGEEVQCPDPNDDCSCMPNVIQSVYKTNNQIMLQYKKLYLLKPGNISVQKDCSVDCLNFGSTGPESFDIRDNKFLTSFRNGDVYLIYYATDYDESGNLLIPENYRIEEYIEAYLKYKVFETLLNRVHDETYNILSNKLMYYENKANEAYILAESEMKKQDVYAKYRSIKSLKRRLNKYNIQ